MTNFLSLPSELRNRVYELCLLHKERIEPWTGCHPRQKFTPGLLRANKTVHREASPIFYGQNRFDFTMGNAEEIALFLRKIGRINAGYIRDIYVQFPHLRDLEPGNVTLVGDSSEIFANIQSCCANLSRLTTALASTTAMLLQLDIFNYPKIATEALTLVNTRFRAISSLQDIVVEVYSNEDGPSDFITSRMEDHGWTVSTTDFLEEDWYDGPAYDGYGDWNIDYPYDSGDYDIDY